MFSIFKSIKNLFCKFWYIDDNDSYKYLIIQFRATLLLCLISIIIIFFSVEARTSIPKWMFNLFKTFTYPLFFYNLVLLIFHKPLAHILDKYRFILIFDILIGIVLLFIGAGWRSSYFAYTFSTLILFAIFGNLKWLVISVIVFIITSLIKNPIKNMDDAIAIQIFSATNLDMRLGAALAYIIAGFIIGYFRHLLNRIDKATKEKILEVEKQTILQNKMKLA